MSEPYLTNCINIRKEAGFRGSVTDISEELGSNARNEVFYMNNKFVVNQKLPVREMEELQYELQLPDDCENFKHKCSQY